jgi:hypothetical protein
MNAQTRYSSRFLICLISPFPITSLAVQDCAQIARFASVNVDYDDPEVIVDERHNIQELKSLSGKGLVENQNVYGLTHAEARLEYEVEGYMQAMSNGSVCMVPQVKIHAGFSELKVYVADDLQDACRRQVVHDHEYEHVNVWRSHMHEGSRLMQAPVLQALAKPRMYADRWEAESALRPWVDSIINAYQNRLFTNLNVAQQAIDSPTSYQYVERRLKSCPINMLTNTLNR